MSRVRRATAYRIVAVGLSGAAAINAVASFWNGEALSLGATLFFVLGLLAQIRAEQLDPEDPS